MKPSYPENATSIERLHWYRDNDMTAGYALAALLDHLEECFLWDVGFEPSDD